MLYLLSRLRGDLQLFFIYNLSAPFSRLEQELSFLSKQDQAGPMSTRLIAVYSGVLSWLFSLIMHLGHSICIVSSRVSFPPRRCGRRNCVRDQILSLP